MMRLIGLFVFGSILLVGSSFAGNSCGPHTGGAVLLTEALKSKEYYTLDLTPTRKAIQNWAVGKVSAYTVGEIPDITGFEHIQKGTDKKTLVLVYLKDVQVGSYKVPCAIITISRFKGVSVGYYGNLQGEALSKAEYSHEFKELRRAFSLGYSVGVHTFVSKYSGDKKGHAETQGFTIIQD